MQEGEHHDQPEEHERDTEPRPRIYVASLSDYNAGRLHGTWIEAAQEPHDIHAEINAMLARSAEPRAEEWAIHDYEGFGPFPLSEYEAIETVAHVAQGIVEHGPAFAHFAAYYGADPTDSDRRFEDAYRGTWATIEDYAEQLLDDLGVDTDALGPDWLQPYISFDLDAFARDLSFDVHVAEDESGVHIFDL